MCEKSKMEDIESNGRRNTFGDLGGSGDGEVVAGIRVGEVGHG